MFYFVNYAHSGPSKTSKMNLFATAVKYVHKNLRHRYLTGFWKYLWTSEIEIQKKYKRSFHYLYSSLFYIEKIDIKFID